MDKNNKYLEVKKLTKVFPGTIALNEVDFEVKSGEIHAIVGENGAGKSTLMKILSGAYLKSSGEILINGEIVEINNVIDAYKYGISMIYQELSNLPKLTVAENIFLGILPRLKKFPIFVDFKQLFNEAKKYFDNYKIAINPKTKLINLTQAEKQFVEIIKAIIIKNAKIIIMDEPTSSLSETEIKKLFNIINELKNNNITVIYISHRLEEITEIADKVTVFRDGRNVGTLNKNEIDKNKIIEMMIGHALIKSQKKAVSVNDIVFEVKNLNISKKISNFNLKLYKGEILGIAGLIGSGKDELIKSLFGLWPTESKEIYYKNKKITINNPKDAINLGIVYLPEERKLASLFLELNVRYNIVPIWLFKKYKGVFINNRLEASLSKKYIEQLNLKTSSQAELILNLSGGNQQKAIVARLLAIKPELMILNDPTRGIDVGSKEEIYSIIRKLSKEGTSIILASSELEEISYLANRVIVLSRGSINDVISGDGITVKRLLTSVTM